MDRRLIEEWLPIAEIGEESARERRSMTALPPTYYLHVWWARRPLVASRAAVLASLLPADADRKKFLHVLGIHGDPVAARRQLEKAKKTGNRIPEPYGYKRAYGYTPSETEIEELLRSEFNDALVLDPTSGGGSIPFEASRLGLSVIANDLNPVAALILRATVEWPMLIPSQLIYEYRRLTSRIRIALQERLGFCFLETSHDKVDLTYLWARTVTCPYCGGLIPLSPNWRLASDGTGVKVFPNVRKGPLTDGRICSFKIVHSVNHHSKGTVSRGDATCPFPDCGRVVDGDEIKRQAQAGQMGEQLYTIVYKERIVTLTKSGKEKEKWVRGYRAPEERDDVSQIVKERVAQKLPEWEALNVVPTEFVPPEINDDRPVQYGMPRWRDLFSARQLYGHATAVEIFHELFEEERVKPTYGESTKAALAYVSFSLDKLLNYNSRLSIWMSTREVIANTFNRHDFAFAWSYAEMAPLIAGLGYDWAFEQTEKCIAELIDLARPDIDGKALRKDPLQAELLSPSSFTPPSVTVTAKSADRLDHIENNSIDVVVIDPPYYDNVMYAELSDFFYVWLKRTAGLVFPELFTRHLTDKDNEAVANPARYRGEKGAKKLAGEEYRERMAAIFVECRRVLKENGIMTLMFTHKATGAWDALTSGLVEAGFVVTASWPINTEAEGSLHIKDKSAANSTVFLVCRPRPERNESEETVYWEDIEPKVRQAVRERIEGYQKAGIKGVDLYLSSFGPALEEFSRHWPVKRGRPRPRSAAKPGSQKLLIEDERDPYETTPEDALEVARREVKEWRLRQLSTVSRQASLDPLTEWFVLAWDAFQAPQFPYDEALRLARVVGIDVDRDIIKKIAEKKASNVILWDSATRAAKGALGPPNGSRAMIDAIHHVAYAARNRNLQAAQEVMEKNSLLENETFLLALEEVLEVLPPSQRFLGFDPGEALRPAADDFEALENLRRLALSEEVDQPEQLQLFEGGTGA